MTLRNRVSLDREKHHQMLNQFDSPLPKAQLKERPYMLDANSYFQARQAVDDAIGNLQDVLPALTKDDKVKLYNLIGPIEAEDYVRPLEGNIGIDEVTEQYMLVQHIRRSVLDPSNTLKHGATPRELTAMVSAMSNLSNLFFRQRDKIDLMQEVQAIKRAVNVALEDCPQEVKEKFITTLQRARNTQEVETTVGSDLPQEVQVEGGIDGSL